MNRHRRCDDVIVVIAPGVVTGNGRAAIPSTLADLAKRLRRLAPSARNPERFHEEKSGIVHGLRMIAPEVCHG